MGKYDTCMQEYLQNKQYFADLFNGCFFHGRPVICANELTEASEGYVVDQDNTVTSEKTLAAVKVKKGGNEEQFQCSVDRTLDQATVSDAAGTEGFCALDRYCGGDGLFQAERQCRHEKPA